MHVYRKDHAVLRVCAVCIHSKHVYYSHLHSHSDGRHVAPYKSRTRVYQEHTELEHLQIVEMVVVEQRYLGRMHAEVDLIRKLLRVCQQCVCVCMYVGCVYGNVGCM
jgi:hypothetical protein